MDASKHHKWVVEKAVAGRVFGMLHLHSTVRAGNAASILLAAKISALLDGSKWAVATLSTDYDYKFLKVHNPVHALALAWAMHRSAAASVFRASVGETKAVYINPRNNEVWQC